METDLTTITRFFKQQTTRDREIAKLVGVLKTIEVNAASARDRLMALLPPTVATGDTPNGGPQRRAGARREPVKVTLSQVEDVRVSLRQLGQAVTIKQLRGAVGLGPKVIAAALRQLAAAGLVTEKRGKWQLASGDAGVDENK
jgi:hypothetical protein